MIDFQFVVLIMAVVFLILIDEDDRVISALGVVGMVMVLATYVGFEVLLWPLVALAFAVVLYGYVKRRG